MPDGTPRENGGGGLGVGQAAAHEVGGNEAAALPEPPRTESPRR
jgi:hypothetical protein